MEIILTAQHLMALHNGSFAVKDETDSVIIVEPVLRDKLSIASRQDTINHLRSMLRELDEILLNTAGAPAAPFKKPGSIMGRISCWAPKIDLIQTDNWLYIATLRLEDLDSSVCVKLAYHAVNDLRWLLESWLRQLGK